MCLKIRYYGYPITLLPLSCYCTLTLLFWGYIEVLCHCSYHGQFPFTSVINVQTLIIRPENFITMVSSHNKNVTIWSKLVL